ncbi:hypothetical protein Pelo_19700 [Pelomyxa schiedti]|nr:hypothetical protein Pelo_19700 [Pelomyxa schiedti]
MIECRMEVLSWLFDEFDLVSTLPSRNHTILGACCGWGQTPADIQLVVQWGIQKLRYKGLAFETLTSLMMNKHGTVELCQWLIDEYGMKLSDVSLGMLTRTKNLEIVRWVLESSSIPIEGVPIKHFCKAFGDVAFTEWLTKERHIPLTHEAFIAACSTQRGV